MAVLVYKYGTRAHWDAPQVVVDQIRLANQLRNTLVEIENTSDADMAAMWSQHPEIAAVEEDLTAATTILEEAIAAAKTQHQQDRTRTTRPKTSKAVSEARKRVRELKATRREHIAAAYAVMKPRIEEIRAARKAAIKATYAKYSQEDGLYWGTYNRTLDHHKVAATRIASARKNGQPAQLRFHRFDGSGSITTQVMRSSGDPIRSPKLLTEGASKWRNVIRLPEACAAVPAEWATLARSEQRQRGAGEIVMSMGTQHGLLTVPVRIHRPLPPDADVAMVELVRTRIASRYETSVCITVKIPDPEPSSDGPPIAVHLGWRRRPDGSTRVATIRSTGGLVVPDGLRDVVACHGRWAEIVFPARIDAVAGRPASLRGRRDSMFAPVLEKLATWLEGNPSVWADDEKLAPSNVRKWKSPGRLASLTVRWRDEPPAGAEGLLAELEAWRRQDKHLWEWEANERQQTTRHRDQVWRNVASWLTTTAGVIVVDDSSMADLRRKGAVEQDPNLPGSVEDAARARAAMVAPGRLRELVTVAAARRGVTVTTVPAAGLSQVCSGCGHKGGGGTVQAASHLIVCDGCGRTYDQDQNAVKHMLKRALESESQT